MKYYIKLTNTKSERKAIMESPVFTSKRKAKEWAEAFEKSMHGIAKAEVTNG